MKYSTGVPDDYPLPQTEALLPPRQPSAALTPSQQGDCPTCGGITASAHNRAIVLLVVALRPQHPLRLTSMPSGRIESRYPRVSIEKELAQAVGKAETHGLADSEATHKVLALPENRYIVRQLCWVLTIEGLDTYLLEPRDPADLSLLIEAVRPRPRATDVDVVIGVKGPVAPSTHCNGLMIPIVMFDQIYSFDVDSLIASLPRPADVDHDRFKSTSEEVFNRTIQIADNTGNTDGHRALNYLAVRYPDITQRRPRNSQKIVL
jgi:PatG Domain